jgi:hypothetical protein
MAEQYEIRWQDYYRILEVEPLCEDEQLIKAAYRKLCLQWGKKANLGDGESTARMKLINEAYEYLSDPNKRAQYNLKFQEQARGQKAAGSGKTAQPKPSLTPTNLHLGTISVGESRTVSFRAENLGGQETDHCHLDYTPTDSWLSLSVDAPTLPCNVIATIDAAGLVPGQTYEGRIVLILDGISAEAKIGFRTIQAASQTTPLTGAQPVPVGIFRWPSWKWQRLALILAIPAALSFFFVPHTYGIILGVVLLVLALYGGIKTNWLRNVSQAPKVAKLAAGAATGISFVGMGLSVVYLAIFGVVIVGVLLAVAAVIAIAFSALGGR